ncbi:MAG: ExbD/TolR family protein [Planctomycetota bacterium]
MTPIIDVVFLLIIFFMLVCQFIAAEQFKVAVPDEIASAEKQEAQEVKPLTITVMESEAGPVTCAIGSEELADVAGKDLALLITSAVDDYLVKANPDDKTIRLRCDKSIPFGQVKHILAGISKSGAENLDWAVLAE